MRQCPDCGKWYPAEQYSRCPKCGTVSLFWRLAFLAGAVLAILATFWLFDQYTV
uniref:Uncharacterized protein n=1 Tax=Magnetococcus massalia (strain MO-1) TaxID=451514 RepID=A0A1S7LFY4_MAGMO|nr:protein of unknown function [Candidatus Magnetococcus massalia]